MLAQARVGAIDAAIHTGRVEIDLGLLSEGYLRSACGRTTRHLPLLERAGRDAASLGVRLYWSALPGDMPGACDCRERVIILAPWLFVVDREVVRHVLTHELGHIMAGECEKRAERWSFRLYGSMLVSEWD